MGTRTSKTGAIVNYISAFAPIFNPRTFPFFRDSKSRPFFVTFITLLKKCLLPTKNKQLNNSQYIFFKKKQIKYTVLRSKFSSVVPRNLQIIYNIQYIYKYYVITSIFTNSMKYTVFLQILCKFSI